MERKKFQKYSRIGERYLKSQKVNGLNDKTSYESYTASNSANCHGEEIISNVLYHSDLQSEINLNKDHNFECEEEWDIGGIPELLTELDADIENSLKLDLKIHSTKFERDKYLLVNKHELFDTCSKPSTEGSADDSPKTVNGFRSFTCKAADLRASNELSLNTTKFAGFSNRGHLISEPLHTKRISLSTTKYQLDFSIHTNKKFSQGMSSQSGSGGGTSGNAGCGGISNLGNGQTISSASSSSKSNTKMSIDHQATLDKGLKMKIKRTKPGTKSSEAKHEIVKATEQQNGPTGGVVSGSSTNQDDTSGTTVLNSATSQATGNAANNPNVTNSANTSGNKKAVAVNNQVNSNISSNPGGNCANSGNSTQISASQTTSLGTKRGSSGHRREKTKDKSSHSSRIAADPKITQSNEKELQDKPTCVCSMGEASISACSNSSCIYRNELTMSQRLSNSSSTVNSLVVPPGIFTPSTDTQTAVVSTANLLDVSPTTNSSSAITQTLTIGGTANAPGPPNRDSVNGANVKISAHIAAQLAAAASNPNFSNGSGLTSTDIKATTNVSSQLSKIAPGIISATVHHTISVPNSIPKANAFISSSSVPTHLPNMNVHSSSLADDSLESPPAKRAKLNDCKVLSSTPTIKKEMVDICIGTSVGTITEPDCLGPCEPGTSVTLEGIVWHETEGGVLVVNVTWRGKTYVGTLLDCTRHDWAPPRFCDSPTDELDARAAKGRGKRGRASITPDLSNFTETRSSIYFSHSHVHSKLRNGTTKGGRNSRTASTATVEKNNSGSSLSSGNGGSTPSTSPTAFLPPRTEKRKSKDEPPLPLNVENEPPVIGLVNASGIPISLSGSGLTAQPQSLINPVTGLNVQISTKKCKTSSPCPISPVLLECPEQDCSKKYKHANGLRYHQSHAHGTASLLDDDVVPETDDNQLTPIPSPVSATAANDPELTSNSQKLLDPNSSALKIPEDSETITKLLNSENTSMSVEQPNSNLQPGDSVKISETSVEEKESPSALSNDYKPSSILSETTQQTSEANIVDSSNNKETNNPLLSIEPNNQIVTGQSSSGNAGILHLGLADIKSGNSHLPGIEMEAPTHNKTDCTSAQVRSPVSDTSNLQLLSAKNNDGNKNLNQDSTNIETFNQCNDIASQVPLNQTTILTVSKTLSSIPAIGKQKKYRKSPLLTEVNIEGFTACNISSRDEVQSPAYSDISDDSTPMNEQQLLDKQQIKNSDILKKTSDAALSSGTSGSSSGQHPVTSPLGGYGVYQFYQQQQFLVQPSTDQQQTNKGGLPPNIPQQIIPSPGPAQQSPIIAEFNKKEPPLDLITKPPLSSNQNLNQQSQDTNKELVQSPGNIPSGQNTSCLSSLPSLGAGALSSPASSKSVSHFYAFNYMSPSYPFNIDQNYVPVQLPAEDEKLGRHAPVLSPSDQQQHQSPVLFKDDSLKEVGSSNESAKLLHQQQIMPNKPIKPEPMSKSDNMKTEVINNTPTPISHIPLHSKDLQGMGVYSNMYQRHPMTLSAQQLSREEELRRYYIFSDQQRRQNSGTHNINVINSPLQGSSAQSNLQQIREDSVATPQGNSQTQNHSSQQIKIKSSTSLNALGNAGKSANIAKEPLKHKQEDEIKVVKQEGQKPTMETQGPPPPPTSQYFLHPSYIASSPFGFDPNHPMYRNVLMPSTSPYNTAPYHLPMPRYHAPEDLSRNTGTKALDALHHAASQYYTTHKIHELSERALKSPNSSNASGPNTVKVSVSSPNAVATPHSGLTANAIGHHSSTSQTSSSGQLSHNLSSSLSTSNKPEILGQKSHVSGTSVQGTNHNETQKPLTSNNSTVISNTGGVNTSGGGIGNSGSATDSRSPPPQRHVHTHHHTHVGLGYPMYPAPYGAAVLASQQAAAVAVINPFPPGPTK